MTALVEERLDDVDALLAGDPQQMLRATATSAAQLRSSATAAVEAGIPELAGEGRPRALVVAGMGGSGIAGDVLAALAHRAGPVPVLVSRSAQLPGWVGAADLVVAVSCSGATQETLGAVEEAARRGARLVAVGAADSPLHRRAVQARATFVPVTAQLAPRASLWALATPLVVLGAALGLLDLGPDGAALEAAASRLEHIAESCRPDHETFVNPAKSLALELAGTLPVAWGAGAGGAVAATRLAAQLAENAKTPAVAGALPEAHHNQVVALDGDLAGGSADADLFRDRVAEEEPLRVRLVLLHDDDGSPEPAALVAASQRLADDRGVRVSTVVAQGAWPLERFAGLVGVVDFASVYLALARGVDPTPVAAIDELKAHRA